MPPLHFLKIRFDIILPSTPASPKWIYNIYNEEKQNYLRGAAGAHVFVAAKEAQK
jgi:hypothetical protein